MTDRQNETPDSKRSLARAMMVPVAAIIVLLAVTYYYRRASAPLPAPAVLSTRLTTPHLEIFTDLDRESLEFHTQFFEGFYAYFQREYFEFKQQQPLRMFLFSTTRGYQEYLQVSGGPSTEFGFYVRGKNMILVNLESGLGTATHELVHHFIEVGCARRPPVWADEGIATFFEKFLSHIDEKGELHISFGYFSNWRFPAAQAKLDQYTLRQVMDEGRQIYLRTLMVFLHQRGMFQPFVRALQVADNDRTAVATLESVCGADLASIERDWRVWVQSQPIDENVMLVPASFAKTQDEWKTWQAANDRVYWDEAARLYKVRDPRIIRFHQPAAGK